MLLLTRAADTRKANAIRNYSKCDVLSYGSLDGRYPIRNKSDGGAVLQQDHHRFNINVKLAHLSVYTRWISFNFDLRLTRV
jgi:hypothetical protein